MSSSILGKVITLILTFFQVVLIFAGTGDTIKVQTFTFGSPQDAWFVMPSADVNVAKILMKYTLKCNPAQSPACGEWDYLTYTFLYEHTGNLDSTLYTHPYFMANGAGPDTLDYSSTPTYTNVPSWEYSVVYDDTLTLYQSIVGAGATAVADPFSTSSSVSHTQMIWLASELTAAGMMPGNISGMDFNFQSPGTTLNNLTIRMKTTAAAGYSAPVFEKGMTTVYQHATDFSLGWDGVDFTTPFYWDGVSNILVDISYDNSIAAADLMVSADDAGFNAVLNSKTNNDKYIEFYNPDYADVIGNPLAGLTDQVTIAFWAQGDPDFQPQDGTTFEAVTSSSARVLNSHTPWSNENVYWDAGNDGGYDRINKAATAADYESNWVYWTFTKNATSGSMKIYKNGVLWHSGTGLTKLMTDIWNLRLGKGNWGGSVSYDGNMEEFAIWNTELDATTIADYMYKDIDAAHPYFGNLILYYHFNDGDGLTEPDAVAGNSLGIVGAVTRQFKGADLFRNGNISTVRPMVRFDEGEYTSHLDSTLIITSVPNDPITLIYFDPADPTTATDTMLVWPSDYYTYDYNADGTISDSTFIAATNTIYNNDLPYYGDPFEVVNRYELARYITPYGNGLDLGDGFTWTFDVSDYRPLLTDSVHLGAGNWQELLDMQLWFIEGTPPRDVKSVTNLWNGNFNYGLTPSFDEQTPAKNITIPADAANSRIKVRVTGHGFLGNANCAEFCSREHQLKQNGSVIWTKEVWRDNCDVNPLYPQGGTWAYDRSNWCPGAEVATYDVELSPFVAPGNTYNFDYSAEDYTWNGVGSVPYYATEVQLITYGPPNFTLDASLDQIIAPSDDDMQQRKNPICNNPIIRITNTGSTPLTSLDITFGIKDFDQDTYTWTGNLAFMESEEVTLPNFGWTNTGSEFIVTISHPNGGTDEYAYNNSITTPLAIPPTYPNDFYIETRTNKASHENDLFVYDENGNTILAHTSFSDETTYRDTLHLEDGCYELYLWDYGEDGLNWWAAPEDGSGWFRTKNLDGSYIKNFGTDFGGLIYQQFTVGNYTPVQNIVEKNDEVTLYPNPASGDVFIDVDLAHLSEVEISITDLTGKIIFTEQHHRTQNETYHFDMSEYASGVYFAVIKMGDEIVTKEFVLDK